MHSLFHSLLAGVFCVWGRHACPPTVRAAAVIFQIPFRVTHLIPHVGCRTDKADWSAGVSSRGVVRAEGVDWGPEAGNSNLKSLSSAVRTATTFKDKSSKDFNRCDIMTLVF